MLKKISNQVFDEERSLYNLKNAIVQKCLFSGPKDGESVLKETRKIKVKDCEFSLRYPMWHVKDFVLSSSSMDEKSRAPLWYAKKGIIEKCKIEKPLIAFCAFNPHAGENGILGREEIEILNPAVEILNSKGINVLKPVSADALFAKVGKDYLGGKKVRYDAILACYHDQGLCPVKALAMQKAINTTIGLDVVRTSPSSGTAYDIAGKNIANPESMIEAVKLAVGLS